MKTSEFQKDIGGTTVCMKRIAIDTKGCLSVCRSGLRGPLAYSLLGGGIPTQSIG